MTQGSQHTPEFIEEMKTALLTEKNELEKELKELAHKESGEYETNYPDYERDEEANAMEMADFEGLNATTKLAQARLEEVGQALTSIEAGQYGVTQEGELIPEDRLRANPAAKTLVK